MAWKTILRVRSIIAENEGDSEGGREGGFVEAGEELFSKLHGAISSLLPVLTCHSLVFG
jgi:hypothetical protein